MKAARGLAGSVSYCFAEANSQYQVDEVQKYLEANRRLPPTQHAFSSGIPTISALLRQKAVDENDGSKRALTDVHLPPSQPPASSTARRPAGQPVLAGEEWHSFGCAAWRPCPSATAILGYNATGEMGCHSLTSEADYLPPMPAECIKATNVTKKCYHISICDDLGTLTLLRAG